MANAVDICNMALGNLGDMASITSLNPPDGSAQAERCARYYPIAVSTMLEEHDWAFATVREELVAWATNDRDNWRFCYAMPAKCLRIIDIVDAPITMPPYMAKGYYDYEVGMDENGRQCIYTNLENAVIRYIKEIDENLFPATFVMALSWRLAAFLAGPMIKGDSGMQMIQSCEKTMAYFLDKAKTFDAMQHREYVETIPEWIARR